MTDWHGLEIQYKWSPRRQSIGLTVTADGKLEVAAPKGTSTDKIAQALDRHRAWIARKALARKEAWGQLQEGMAYFLGQPYRLTLTPDARGEVELRPGDIRVCVDSDGASHWGQLKAWYCRQAEMHLYQRVRHFAAAMGLMVGQAQIHLRGWKSRWGECHTHNGALRFNWRLIMLPPMVLDYVVVHELAHLKVPGHNPRFWRIVATVLPDYAAHRGWLKHYGAPFLIWQPELLSVREEC